MKNKFNEAVVTNPEEVKGGFFFLFSWLFGGFKHKPAPQPKHPKHKGY